MITDKQVVEAVNQFEATLPPLEQADIQRMKLAKRYMSKNGSKSFKFLANEACKLLKIENNEYTQFLLIEIALTDEVLLSTQIETLKDFRAGIYFMG